MVQKQKKSLKKFARTRLTEQITKRRKLKPVVKEMRERAERKKKREEREEITAELEHVKQLKELEEEDKEFVDFLRAEEPELLEFGEDALAENEDDQEEEDGGADLGGPTDQLAPELTQTAVDHCFDTAFHQPGAQDTSSSTNSLRNAALTFRMAVQKLYVEPSKLRSDPTFLVRTIQTAIRNFPVSFDRTLGRTQGGVLPKKCAKYKSLSLIIRSFVANCSAIITSNNVEKNTLAYVLHSLGELATEYVGIFPLYLKRILRIAIRASADLEDDSLRDAAVLFIRSSAQRLGGSVREMCYKGMFLSLMSVSRTYSAATHAAVDYSIRSIVDVYGIDLVLAYQTVFVYLKQLAMYLRTALIQSSDETAIRNLHNWQFVLSLRTWSEVVCEYNAENQLWPLVYPLVQICLGVLDVFSSSRTFPLHFHVFDVLNTIAERCAVHIPLTPHLMRIFNCPSLASKSLQADKEGNVKVQLQFQLRVNKQSLKSMSYQTSVLQELLYHTARHTAAFAHTISYPETFSILHAHIKKFSKAAQRVHWSTMVAEYLKKVSMTEEVVKKRRSGVSFGPCDDDQIKLWEAALREDRKSLAVVGYVESQRRRRDEAFKLMVKHAEETEQQRTLLEDVVEEEEEN